MKNHKVILTEEQIADLYFASKYLENSSEELRKLGVEYIKKIHTIIVNQIKISELIEQLSFYDSEIQKLDADNNKMDLEIKKLKGVIK